MRRQIVLGTLPLVLVGFVVGYARMVAAERAAKKSGGTPSRPRVWAWTVGCGLAAMVLGAVVALLSGLADHSDDLVHSALSGTFMLAPGLVVGIATGWGRWLGSRTVWRGRAKGLG